MAASSRADSIVTFRFRATTAETDLLERIARSRHPHDPFPTPTALREALEEYLQRHAKDAAPTASVSVDTRARSRR